MPDVFEKAGPNLQITQTTVKQISIDKLREEQEFLVNKIAGIQSALDKINAYIIEADKLGLK